MIRRRDLMDGPPRRAVSAEESRAMARAMAEERVQDPAMIENPNERHGMQREEPDA